ncbi:CD276 antigen homolog isoform X2 [Eleginops maclovinus]|uniref:CD276 antigen homolog isoform X2 n=1 Tax=Eleginops maclovinus TaxID=56733 RepID=UPI003080543A
MSLPQLLVSALVFCIGEALEDIGSLKIQAIFGEMVILPCNVSVESDVPSVEWSKENLNPPIVFLYRGCETFEEQNPTFQFRTNLFLKELKEGNLSLRLSNVQLSDKGKYKCKTIKSRPLEVASIDLSVGAVSEPKLSVVSSESGNVTLQCEADCWFPEPEMTFLTAQGNITNAQNTKAPFDSRRLCFNVTKRVTVQAGERVTCRVHQDEINQTRHTHIHTPGGPETSCTLYIIIAVILPVIVCAVFACLWRRCVPCVKDQKCLPCKQYTRVPITAEGHNKEKETDSKLHELQRKIRDLESTLLHKDEQICSLNKELDDLRSKQCSLVDLHGQPTIMNGPSHSSPDVSKPLKPPGPFPHDDDPKPTASTNNNCQKTNQNSKPTQSLGFPRIQKGTGTHSSPALLTRSDRVSPRSPSASSSWQVERSQSMSESGSRSKRAKHPRRNTNSYASPSSNRFFPLANLPE